MQKYGFILQGKFYPNEGYGHEANARAIVQKKGWNCTSLTYQDYLVLEKRAIQIGSGSTPDAIIACSRFYSRSEVERIGKKYRSSPKVIMY